MNVKKCKCGRVFLTYEDQNDYFYQKDIFYCYGCCLIEKECDCKELGTK